MQRTSLVKLAKKSFIQKNLPKKGIIINIAYLLSLNI